MRRYCRILTVGLILLLVAAACGGSATAPPIAQPLATATEEPTAAPVATDTPMPTETQAPTPTAMPAPMAAMVNTTSRGNLGVHLVDGDGMTIYLYTRDERNVTNCSGGCAEAWPPLITEGEPTLGEGVDEGRLGTITREDGSSQVTYNGRPLYRFSRDEEAGDANGQDSRGVWFAVSTNGGPIQSNAAVNTVENPELNQSQGGNYILERWQRHGRCKHQCVGSGL